MCSSFTLHISTHLEAASSTDLFTQSLTHSSWTLNHHVCILQSYWSPWGFACGCLAFPLNAPIAFYLSSRIHLYTTSYYVTISGSISSKREIVPSFLLNLNPINIKETLQLCCHYCVALLHIFNRSTPQEGNLDSPCWQCLTPFFLWISTLHNCWAVT